MFKTLTRTVLTGAIAATALPALGQVDVALVGDSITRGQWWLGTTYPEHLQTMLDDAFGLGVYNIGRYENEPRGPGFGHSGATLRDDGNLPYVEQPAYTASLAFQPDIAIIMLGSNDAKPGINWDVPALDGDMTSLEHFIEDYEALIDSYDALASAPYIAVMSPIPVSTVVVATSDIDAAVIENEIAPAVRNTIANYAPVDALVDLNLLFPEDNAGFYASGDKIHPNSAGNAFIAQQVFDLLVQAGDLNLDHHVDAGDLDILLANWGQTVTAGDRSLGDTNGDGLVDDLDLAIIQGSWGEYAWGFDAAGAGVPEPGTAAALLVGVGLLVRRRRRA